MCKLREFHVVLLTFVTVINLTFVIAINVLGMVVGYPEYKMKYILAFNTIVGLVNMFTFLFGRVTK